MNHVFAIIKISILTLFAIILNGCEGELADSRLKLKDTGFYQSIFSQNGKLLITGNNDLTVSVWNLKTRNHILNLERPDDSYDSYSHLSLSDDSNYVVASQENHLLIWDVNDGKIIQHLVSSYPIRRLTINKDASLVAVLYRNNMVELFSTATKETFWKIAYGSNIEEITLSKDGSHILISTSDKKNELWDIKNNKIKHEIKLNSKTTFTKFSDNNKYILISSMLKPIMIYDFNSGKKIQELSYNGKILTMLAGRTYINVTSCIIDEKNKTVTAVFPPAKIYKWDIDSGMVLNRFKIEATKKSRYVIPSIQHIDVRKNKLSASTSSGTIYIWDQI